jgi:PAS domain S-box-containing protein
MFPPLSRLRDRMSERFQSEAKSEPFGLTAVAELDRWVEPHPSELEIRSIIDTAHEAFVSIDARGLITNWNPQAEQTFGWTREEALGRELAKTIIPERYREAHAKGLERFLETGEGPVLGQRLELAALGRDGHEFPVEISISAVRSEGGWAFNAFLHDITERKQAEQELRLARELALAVAGAERADEALAVAVRKVSESAGLTAGQAWILSPDGSRLVCSPGWYTNSPELEPFRQASEAMSFEPGRSFIGRAWDSREATWVDDLAADPDCLRVASAGKVGIGAALAVPVPASDEVVAVLEFLLDQPRSRDEGLLRLVSGAAAQVGSLIRRKQAEDALRKSEERFRLLIENVRDYAIFMIDASGHVVSWNQGAARITGYEADEIVGYHISRFYTPDAVEQGEPDLHLEQASREGKFQQSEWRVRKDGLLYWANVLITALHDEHGELRGFSYITQDMSVSRQAEEELRRLSAIVEHSADAIISTTPDKRIVTSWNKGAERLFGYTAREMIGRPASVLVPPEEAQAQEEMLRQVREGGRVEHYETQALRKDGSLVDLSLSMSPVKYMTGELIGISSIARDISERKRAQSLLEEAFGTYLDRDVAEHILREGPSLTGEEVDVTMMFIDIRDFTAFAEQYEAPEVVATLNELFELAVPIITGKGGHVDKFVGDGLLAVFGAPQRLEDHACRAVEAALEIERAAAEQFQGDLEIGIGIDSGPVVAGNVGGGGRLDFTVIGNAVNMAARVESATRETGDTLLISQSTRDRVGNCAVAMEERRDIRVKGRCEPVVLYACTTSRA